MKASWGSRGIAALILKFGIAGRRMVSFTSRPTGAGIPVYASVSVWTVLSGGNQLPLPGIEPGCFQSVAYTTVCLWLCDCR